MEISSLIVIKSTPEVVFGWLENPQKAREWMTSVSNGEILHETPGRVGTTFREIVEDEGGSIEMQGRITGFKANKLISFHLDSRVNSVNVEYSVEKIIEGTRLAYHANVHWKFPVNIIYLFMGKKIKLKILGQLENELKTLKGFCEG